MKTWNDYKQHVREVDPEIAKDINEAEESSAIISAMIKRRNELGLSQRDLAAQCGIPQSSVARIESHSTVPRLDTLLKIFDRLGLTFTVQPKTQV
jgi:DNA-binding XRE family transcriptional regulator